MSIQERRERERAEREKLIIAAARELAEAEGWDAVTTRRLAERVEYSQPVLYSHFDGKDAIKTAVAVEGFAELATGLAAARAAAPDPARALAAVSDAYMDFARRRPALYDAMFSQTVDLPFATAAAPPPCTQASVNSPKRSGRTQTATTWACSPRSSGRRYTAWRHSHAAAGYPPAAMTAGSPSCWPGSFRQPGREPDARRTLPISPAQATDS